MPPQAPGKNHLNTANSDDNIKESFLLFSQGIKELDEQLDNFARGFTRLGHVTAILSAIKAVREMLQRTREVFFHNALILVPDLYNEARGSSSEPFYIRENYLNGHTCDYETIELPTVLGQLAGSFSLLHARVEEFPEFTEQGSHLKYLLSTLEELLRHRALCVLDNLESLSNPPMVQYYIQQIVCDLQTNFEEVAAALAEFITTSIPAIRAEQARIITMLANILAAAALFSGVTASTLQISMGQPDQNDTILVVNALWFTSLILSVGAALNCVLYIAFVYLLDVIKPLISSNSNPGKLPPWIRMWMDGSHSFLLGASILTFSAGLSVFTFSSNQAIYTPYLIIASMMLASAGLGAILIWILYKILTANWQAGGNSNNPGSKRFSSFRGRIAAGVKNALPWLLPRKLDRPRDDMEEGEIEGLEMLPSHDQEANSSDQDGVKSVSIDRKKGHAPDPDEIKGSAALTKLILPDETVPEKIGFKRHGTIRHVDYSDDGKWLAITCAKEKSNESWTTVLDAKTLESIGDIRHSGKVISEFLKWSPSGKKLIVTFESGRRCDVWDLATECKSLHFEWDIMSNVGWLDDAVLLVTLKYNAMVVKMDLTGHQMGKYTFSDAIIRSTIIERKMNYFIVISYVAKTPEPLKLVNRGQSEKRIAIYDLDNLNKKLHQIPFLDDICITRCGTQLLPGTLDLSMIHKGHKNFQLWSLDFMNRDPRSEDILKKRTARPYDNVDPEDTIVCNGIGGNHNQYVFSMMTSGNIYIRRRESGMPYGSFSSPILLEERIQCFSWRKSDSDDETATFATAGFESHVLRIWRGKQVPETSDIAMNEESRDPSQRAVDEVVASSSALSVPPGAKEVEEGNILKVDPPNGPEAGPSTSNS